MDLGMKGERTAVRGEMAAPGTSGWTRPLLMTFLITVLASVTSLGLTAWFAAAGHQQPGEATMSLINIWNTLLYIPALLALVYVLQREGATLGDLVGLDRSRLRRDILQGLGLGLLLLLVAGVISFGVSAVLSGLLGNPFAGKSYADMPVPSLASVLFGLIGVPLGAGIVEELVYRGYAQTRFTALAGRFAGLVIPAIGFGLQHWGLALSGDYRFGLMRAVALFLVGLVMGVIYRKQQRLLPLIIAHIVWDVIGIGIPALLPLLQNR